MGDLVDLIAWREGRSGEDAEGADSDIRRLELAVTRLDEVASARLEETGKLAPSVETELLAILGALTGDLIREATTRTERLARRLASGGGAGIQR